MRYRKLVFTLLVAATTLVAADHFIGTWKLDPAKTVVKSGAAPREETVTISGSGSDYDVVIKITAADGTPLAIHYTVPKNGGVGKVIDAPFDAVSMKRINANELEVTWTKGGKVVLAVHPKVAKNRKTTTTDFTGTNAAGLPIDYTQTYEKQ